MRVLNVGTPLDLADPNPGEDWMQLNCQFCDCGMVLRKKSMQQPEGAEIVLCCMRCLSTLTEEYAPN